MPNWVQNEIYLNGNEEDIKKVLELVKSDDSEFDFNKLVPMPNTLNIPSGGHDDQSIQYAISKMSKTKQTETKSILLKTECSYYGNYFKKVYGREFTIKELEDCAKEFAEKRAKVSTNPWDSTDYNGLGIKTLEDLGNMYIHNIITYGCDTWYDWCCEYWGTKWNSCEVYIDDNLVSFQTAWSVPDPIFEAFAYLCDEHNVTFEGKYADEDTGCNTGYISSEHGITEYEDNSSEALNAYVELWGYTDCIGEDENGILVHYDCDTCPNKCC